LNFVYDPALRNEREKEVGQELIWSEWRKGFQAFTPEQGIQLRKERTWNG
jgi:hypothetical protein